VKFRAHDTFFIRKGWLNKGMKSVYNNPNVFMGQDKDGNKINPMDELGIGANMVKSLRYWLQATGLTQEKTNHGKRNQALTDLGKIIYRYDRYIEETGTLCLLQHQLCAVDEYATAWFFFFNEFNLHSFSMDDFFVAIEGYIGMNGVEKPSDRSLKDDFECIIHTYISRSRGSNTRTSPENNTDCPLGDLELIEVDNKKTRTYRKRCVNKTMLPSIIALAMILEQADGETEIPIGKLLNGAGSIGRVFNLDTVSLTAILNDLENSGYIKIIRTAGLDVIRIESTSSYLECVESYYKSIS